MPESYILQSFYRNVPFVYHVKKTAHEKVQIVTPDKHTSAFSCIFSLFLVHTLLIETILMRGSQDKVCTRNKGFYITGTRLTWSLVQISILQ